MSPTTCPWSVMRRLPLVRNVVTEAQHLAAPTTRAATHTRNAKPDQSPPAPPRPLHHGLNVQADRPPAASRLEIARSQRTITRATAATSKSGKCPNEPNCWKHPRQDSNL